MPLATVFRELHKRGVRFQVAEFTNTGDKFGQVPAKKLIVEADFGRIRVSRQVVSEYLSNLGGQHGFRVMQYLPPMEPPGKPQLPIDEILRQKPETRMFRAEILATHKKANALLEAAHQQILSLMQGSRKK